MPRKPKPPAAPKPGFSFKDVLALTSATRSNLIYWLDIGLVQPAFEDTAGPGHPRRFSGYNIFEVALCAAIAHPGLSTEVLRIALAEIRGFHTGAIAVHEQFNHAPVTTGVVPALFSDLDSRRAVARRWLVDEIRRSTPGRQAAQRDIDIVQQQVVKIAKAWDGIRRGPLAQGVPDQCWGGRFLGLFLGGVEDGGRLDDVRVVLDPPDLSQIVFGQTSIVVNLANVVFEMGRRCARLGVQLGEW